MSRIASKICPVHHRVHRKGETLTIPLDVWERLAHQVIAAKVAAARSAQG
jgi:hypothetical protein